MKIVQRVLAVSVVWAMTAGAAWAGDRATGVSKSNLHSMGFGNAKVMSDSEGLAVRGRGHFAFAATLVTVNGFPKLRVDYAPPGNAAFTHAFLTNGTLFASGHSFAYAK